MRLRLAIFLVAAAIPLSAKDAPHIFSAKVISQDIASASGGAAAMPIGTMIVSVPINIVTNTVVVETDKAFMTWVEKRTKHPLLLPVNGTVQFYQDGNWIVVMDAKHKKHRFAVTRLEHKQA